MDIFDSFREAVIYEGKCDAERTEARRLYDIAQETHQKSQEARASAYAALLRAIRGGG